MRRRLITLAVTAGLLAGLVPLGSTPAVAAQCDSQYHLWFWYGVRVEVSGLGLTHPTTGEHITHVDRTKAPPANIDSTYYSCTLAPAAGLSMNNPVLPGATLVNGRDDGSQCVDVFGHIHGLGVGPNIVGAGSPDNGVGLRTAHYVSGDPGDHRVWKFPRDPLGACDGAVLVPGAGSGLLPMDPTRLGTISAWTDRGAPPVTYHTIDR